MPSHISSGAKILGLVVTLLALTLRAAEIGQALPREGNTAALDHLAPHLAADFSGSWWPAFGDFHTRLGARMAFNFSFQPQPGVSLSTRGMPESAMRSLICGIEEKDGARHLLPLLGAAKEIIPASALQTPDGATGLRGEYFANGDLRGEPTLTRTDQAVDFLWNAASPDARLARTNYSVRWTGTLTPAAAGECQLLLTADDGVRLWLDDRLLVDDWNIHAPKANAVSFNFTNGSPHRLRLEYFQGLGGAEVHLAWLPRNRDTQNLTEVTGQRMTMQTTTYATKDDFTVTVSAPFDRSRELDPKSFAVRAQLSPVFFVTLTATNRGATTRTGNFLLGLDHVAQDIQGAGWTGLAFQDLPEQAGKNLWPTEGKISTNSASTFLAVTTEASGGVVRDREWAGASGSPGVVAVPFEIAPGQTASRTFVVSGFTDRPYVQDQRTGKPLRLYYTTIWPTHQTLLDWTWANRAKLESVTAAFDRSLHLESIPAAERFVTVIGCRGYLENSGLTVDDTGRVYYAVFEAGFSGGYVNTMDLVPDTMVWDLNFHPWTLANVLRHYRDYTRRDRYGLSISHDMGAHNYGTKEQYLQDGGPNMATEQAANYLHATYALWRFTGRDAAWLAECRETIGELVASLRARDSDGDGIQDLVTDIGREGNTVDDGTDMGHNRNNHYMAVKELIAFAGAQEMLAAAGEKKLADDAGAGAQAIAAAIHRHMEKHDRLWTDLDATAPNHDAPNVHLLKGLFTAAITGMDLSKYPTLLADCRKHLQTTQPMNAMFYGYPIVAHEPWLTWNSHSIMVDVAAKRLLGGLEMNVGERMANAFYFAGHANEFYNARDPRITNQWPKEQHYSRMAAALGWLDAAQLKP